ncbi:sulfite exporter TauE/SafE family protein [Vibrio breoganii]|uniref:sulfite exporter TauE/SafE family protein n=1 Tax=Vibrio breoganii TaxID=553239 RepID=UPI0021C2D2C4|nr:sulfite exporter TauE/SafE family protein [Vibrio breoganii]MDN3717711.1 sulfite exporter TauE/SafE family protein [Vibrio breoganii]
MDPNIIIASILIFIGAFIQTTTGFGMAIVVSPVLILIAPDFIPGPMIIVGLFLSSINAIKYRDHISLVRLKSAFVGLLPGIISGGLLLYFIDVTKFSLFIGIVVLLAVIVSLLPMKIDETPRRLVSAGFLSGFLGMSSGIGGPPLALLWQHQAAMLVRANLAAFFVISSIISLIIQIPIGYMSMKHLYLSLPLLPASYFGGRLAIIFVERIPQHMVRALSLGLCSIAALGTIYSSIIRM